MPDGENVSIRLKLLLLLDALVLLAVAMFGGIMYTAERAILQRQARETRESALQSLAKVAAESALGEDESTLISYTAGLKRITPALETAYVTDARGMVIAHTDKELAPKPLPLSYSGQRVRTATDKLFVRSRLPKVSARGVSFSYRTVYVNGRRYEAAVGFSDARVNAATSAALSATLRRLAKASAIVFATATLVALWLSAMAARPIRRLLRAFAATGAGDRHSKLPDTGRRDEIGALYREFNTMVDRLLEFDEMKKDFVSSVTHELKSPLGAIESYLDLMAYEVAQGTRDPASWPAKLPKFMENINFIKKNSGRLLRFITDLLDAAKMEKGRFEVSCSKGSVEPLIAEAVRLFSGRAAEAGVELRTELQQKLPQVRVDPERITQVLQNLLSNAIKYTPRGGAVTLSAAAGLSSVGGKGALRVTVADTGPGVPQEALDKLFGKFYQAPGSRRNATGPKGTGLGLYIAKTIVEAHGGTVGVESSPKGSRFWFELPLRGEDL